MADFIGIDEVQGYIDNASDSIKNEIVNSTSRIKNIPTILSPYCSENYQSTLNNPFSNNQSASQYKVKNNILYHLYNKKIERYDLLAKIFLEPIVVPVTTNVLSFYNNCLYTIETGSQINIYEYNFTSKNWTAIPITLTENSGFNNFNKWRLFLDDNFFYINYWRTYRWDEDSDYSTCSIVKVNRSTKTVTRIESSDSRFSSWYNIENMVLKNNILYYTESTYKSISIVKYASSQKSTVVSISGSNSSCSNDDFIFLNCSETQSGTTVQTGYLFDTNSENRYNFFCDKIFSTTVIPFQNFFSDFKNKTKYPIVLNQGVKNTIFLKKGTELFTDGVVLDANFEYLKTDAVNSKDIVVNIIGASYISIY